MSADYDVVVVGYGPAGASTAIAAHDAGARVLVLEAGPAGGGNAIHSGGFLFDLPRDLLVDHISALCFGRTPLDIIETYADGIVEMWDWLRGLGADMVEPQLPPGRFPASFPNWPNFPDADQIKLKIVGNGEGRWGKALWDVLAAAVESRGINVRVDAPVDRLIVEDGNVLGVLLTDESEVRAASVVLACGGFECNRDLVESYLPLGPADAIGNRYNFGTGLTAAEQVDAALWHMYGFFGWFSVRVPEFASPFAMDFFGPGYIYVGADARRFADETGYEVHDRLRALTNYLPRNPNRPGLPTWVVFDESVRLAGPLNGLLGTPNDYVWSADNSVEVERGWIKSATSAGGLAAATGLDASTLSDTLERYNSFAAAGRDTDFDRETETLVPLDLSRLYAVQTWPGLAGTSGGPRHDTRARVVRRDGSVVPGLYAAGGVSMVWGYLIEHGGGLSNSMVFGRVAGREAAASAR